MASWRFLLSLRWGLFALAVAGFVAGSVWLGNWQFDRLQERRVDNGVVRTNESLEPAPVDSILAPGAPVDDADEWRLISATGRYLPEETVVVRYRSRGGAQGIDVVVPLLTDSGSSLLVDRGWLQTDPNGADRGAIPPPPSDTVTVTGWVRADGRGDSTQVSNLSTRAISSSRIGEALDREVYGGFVELRDEDGFEATGLERVELPDLGNGPHFFYGLQWWFFGLLGVAGFTYLAYDERRHGRRGQRGRRGERRPSAQKPRSAPPSTGSMTPERYDAAGESTKAATLPNSSGAP